MSDIQALMEAATAAWGNGVLDETRRLSGLLAEALGPEHPGVRLLHGRLAYAQGDRAGALFFLEQARPHFPDDHALLLQIAELHLRNRAWGPAAEAATQAVALDPPIDGQITATAYLCVSARALGKPDDAAAAARALDKILERQQLSLKAALVKFNALNAAIAIITATGDLAAAQGLFTSTFVKRGEEAKGRTVISDVDTLDQWCAENGVAATLIEPAAEVVLAEDVRGNAPARYVAAAFYAAVIPHAEIFSGWEFAMAPQGTVLGLRDIYGVGFPPFFHLYSEIARTAIHYWPARVIDIPDAALFMPAPLRMHIGHWILDCLPRLQALADHPGMKVALPSELPAKHRDLLRFFGVDPGRIIDCDIGRRYRFRELLVTQYDIALRPSPGKIRFLANALRKPRVPGQRSRRLFLSRGAVTRNIVNQDEVNRTLAEFDFEHGSLSTMSNDEQRERLGATDIVIAIHGSDLIAAYFMQPRTDLIELNCTIDDGAAAPACAFLGIGYHLLMCREVETKVKQYKKDRDFAVDCAALRGLVTAVIARKASQQP